MVGCHALDTGPEKPTFVWSPKKSVRSNKNLSEESEGMSFQVLKRGTCIDKKKHHNYPDQFSFQVLTFNLPSGYSSCLSERLIYCWCLQSDRKWLSSYRLHSLWQVTRATRFALTYEDKLAYFKGGELEYIDQNTEMLQQWRYINTLIHQETIRICAIVEFHLKTTPLHINLNLSLLEYPHEVDA